MFPQSGIEKCWFLLFVNKWWRDTNTHTHTVRPHADMTLPMYLVSVTSLWQGLGLNPSIFLENTFLARKIKVCHLTCSSLTSAMFRHSFLKFLSSRLENTFRTGPDLILLFTQPPTHSRFAKLNGMDSIWRGEWGAQTWALERKLWQHGGQSSLSSITAKPLHTVNTL